MITLHLLSSPNADQVLDNLLKTEYVQGKALTIDYSTEANYYLDNVHTTKSIYEMLHELLDKHNINPQDVTFITGNLLNQQSYNNFLQLNKHIIPLKHVEYSLYWLYQTVKMHKDYSCNYNETAKRRHFSCLNGRNRSHRNVVFEHLTQNDLIDKGICTFVWKGMSVDGYMDPNIITSHTIQQKSFYDVFDDTYYDVITETSVGDVPFDWWTEIFFTEKLWRSIYYKRPFLLIGNANALQKLQDLGFQTFNNILFDETYDTIIDPTERTNAVLNENKRIVENISLEAVHDIVNSQQMAQILQNNYDKINRITKQHSVTVSH